MVMPRFADEDLDKFRVADVLAAFGLPNAPRCPCPLCLTSNASQAFTHRGVLWNCFACGRKGNQLSLYAALGGVSYGAACRAIAGHLGLTPGDPEGMQAATLARQAAEAEAREREEIEAVRWRARLVRRDRLRARIATLPPTPLAWDMMGNLYAALGRVEAWIEQTEFKPKTWEPV